MSSEDMSLLGVSWTAERKTDFDKHLSMLSNNIGCSRAQFTVLYAQKIAKEGRKTAQKYAWWKEV